MSAESVAAFAAMRGHHRVRDFLRAAVAQHRLPHALLFAGSDGVGKRSVALALVAWLQCDEGGADACGQCRSCRQLAAGSHPDVQLVTVASGKKEIGVERAREVKRFTQLQPLRGKIKVALIDDAHMLTVAAQNALLKTLEEPPDHSLLILISHSPDALLPTVRSRCQRVQFAPLPSDIVVAILTDDHGLDPSAARQLAALAEGSPGRALALRRCAGKDGPLQLAALGGARYVDTMQLAQALGQPEADAGLKLEVLLSQLRDEAARSLGAPHLALADPPAPALAAGRAVRLVVRSADLVHGAREALRRGTPNRQLLLEALLLRLARA